MKSEVLAITILGSGTSTGVPVLGCSCSVCTSTDPRNRRTRCSALLSHGGRNILIDTSTDFRQQALREGIDRVDAVLYTHTHADHVHGIDDLRPFNPPPGEFLPLYGAKETLGILQEKFDYIFGGLDGPGYRPRLAAREVKAPFPLFGLEIEPVPLLHGSEPSCGYRIGAFAYLCDCSEIPEASRRRLGGLEVLVIDALRFRPHDTHFNIAGAIEAASQLGAKRTLLTHLSHEVDHSRHGASLPDGVEFAYDGQRIEIRV